MAGRHRLNVEYVALILVQGPLGALEEVWYLDDPSEVDQIYAHYKGLYKGGELRIIIEGLYKKHNP